MAATGPETVSLIPLDFSSQPEIEVTAEGGGAPETPDTPLFLNLLATDEPLLGPDGHQLTHVEWVTAEGTATITCEEGGTRYELEFSSLVPNGVYTIWHFPTREPITSRLPSGRIEHPMRSGKGLDSGALGEADGAENEFTADAEGNGALNVLAAERGLFPKCTLAGGTFLVLAYHMDNRTWGADPGPASVWQAVFTYPSLEDSGNGPEFPTGRFESTGRAFEFNEDGTYGFFRSSGSDVPAVEGTFSVDGDLYTELTSSYAPCPFPGTYAWTYDGQHLTFHLVDEDACSPRRAAYDGKTYTKSQ